MKYYFLITKTDLLNNSGHMIKIISNKLKPMVWILATILTTLFFSCEKDDDPFKECRKHPDCEYFTCKIDGKRWEPLCDGGPLFGCTPWDVQYYRNTPNLFMIIKNESLNQYLRISCKEKLTLGGNNLNTKGNFKTMFFNDQLQIQCEDHYLDTLYANSFSLLTIDTTAYRISGTFNLRFKNDCNSAIDFTDGEFNLPYRF